MPPLFRPRALEWARPDSKGAALRPHRPGRQSRRGREGALLLSRLHADAFLHEGALQISAGGISLRAADRGKSPPRAGATEFELIDTGVFEEDRYFDVFAEYAKAAENDILIRLTIANRGPEKATLHLLPTLWFRNTWSWGQIPEECTSKPSIALERDGLVHAHHDAARRISVAYEGDATPLFTENETNSARLYGYPNGQPFVKDAFHEYVVHGRTDAVNPAATPGQSPRRTTSWRSNPGNRRS